MKYLIIIALCMCIAIYLIELAQSIVTDRAYKRFTNELKAMREDINALKGGDKDG